MNTFWGGAKFYTSELDGLNMNTKQQVVFVWLSDVRQEDESDIEINMPGSDDETEGATGELRYFN